MGNFAISVLSSVLGGLILLLITILASKNARAVFIGVFGRLLGVDIDFVYRNKKESEERVRKEIKNARWIKIFTGRGNELQRDTFKSIFTRSPSDKTFIVEILIPQTSIPKGHYDWLAQRERELSIFDPAFGDGLLRKQVESNYSLLLKHAENSVIKVRRCNVPNIGRIIITDRCLMYTPYRSDAYARDCKVYVFRKQDEMYDNLLRFFHQVWEATT